MPTFARSPDNSTHSWSFVYLNPAGYVIRLLLPFMTCGIQLQPDLVRLKADPTLRVPLIKRHRDDLCTRAASANVDVELGARLGVLDRYVCHADCFLQERRLGAAGHPPHRRRPRIAADEVLPVPRDPCVDHFEADDLPAHAGGLLL